MARQKACSARHAGFFLGLLLCSTVLFSQPQKSLDARISELEKRVAELEKIQKLNAPVAQSEATREETADAGQSIHQKSNAPARALPIKVRLVEKSLQEKGPGEESDRLGFSFEFKNAGSDHITSFSGEIVLLSEDGEEMHVFPFDIAQYVTKGSTTRWFASIPFLSVNQTHRTLQSCSLESLRIQLRLRQVMYYDTRIENFNY